jgi:hypothetical protein
MPYIFHMHSMTDRYTRCLFTKSSCLVCLQNTSRMYYLLKLLSKISSSLGLYFTQDPFDYTILQFLIPIYSHWLLVHQSGFQKKADDTLDYVIWGDFYNEDIIKSIIGEEENHKGNPVLWELLHLNQKGQK